jgi:transcriptional regulator with XRE-family HTH domain
MQVAAQNSSVAIDTNVIAAGASMPPVGGPRCCADGVAFVAARRRYRRVNFQGQELNITINEELRSFIDPLTANESAALERSLLAEGCRDALVLWGDTLIDGHNRYDICTRHGIEFRTVQNTTFSSLDDVMLWMIDNHLARRSVSDYQRGVLALRKKDIVTARVAQRAAEPESEAAPVAVPESPPWNTREDVAKAARVSSNTISQIERIQKAATPQLVEAVRAGTISINAAANVASLPQSEQIAAVAGGRKELQLAARQVREQKAGSRPPKETPADEAAELRAQVAALRDKVDALQLENAALKEQLGI